MELTEEQKNSVRAWAAEGLGLSDIQKRIVEELGIPMTYMDVRFLVLDLGADLQDREVPQTVDLSAPPVDKGGATRPGDPDAAMGNSGAPGAGGVSVELDRVVKPGSVVSGTVLFSDGTNATWFMDQAGRLALDAGTPGYQPSEEDLQSFQIELRQLLEKRGF
ncbi:MAG: hypothetical protein O2923_09740 [Verrucomicrobia bacterium]|nr:hypothetical protein [Verrucomicrobiota bacterium]MDA1087455.1 hypothetical protein [Verrucomicrobiota bacterium]